MTDPEKESEKQQGLSKEAWAAIGTIVVALIGGIVTIFTTVWKPPSSNLSSSPPAGSSSVSTPVPTVPSSTSVQISDIIFGKWSGVAKEPSGTSFPINVEINRDCNLYKKCGYISVPKVPCYGEISLQKVSNNNYEFDVSNFDSRSNLKLCKPGAGEHFYPLPDGKLAYRATYSNAEGVLEKVGN
jgi:hypothetical protein